MTNRTAKLVSRGILAACVVMVVADVALLVAADAGSAPSDLVVVGDPNAPGMAAVRSEIEGRLARGDRPGLSPFEPAVFGAVALIWVVTGSLIVTRQPRNLAGWIFVLVAAAVPVNGLAFAYTVYGTKFADSLLPLQGAVAIVGEYSFTTAALIPLLFLLFPDGRPPSPRWAWAARALVAGYVLSVGAFVLQPGPLNNFVEQGILYENPLGLSAFEDGAPGSIVIPVGVLTILAASLATVVAVRQRFRRAAGEERQQMRWLVSVATVAGAFVLLLIALIPVSLILGLEDGGSNDGGPPIFEILWVLAALIIFLGIPAAYLVAILRYRLWDLDVVIRKAVVAGAVVVAITGIGVVVLVGVPVLVIGVDSSVGLAPVIVGIVLGMLVWPLRGRARRLADRLVYGKRASPYEVLAEFSEHVGGTYASDDVLPRMAQILGRATGATSARVWLRIGTELRPAAVWPADADRPGPLTLRGDGLPNLSDDAVEVRHRGELLGALSVAMPASDPLDPARERLIRDLAAQAGLVLRNVRLIEELRASRQRLVAAQDEERRRIERNLHDGAQQQLVAVSVKARLARATAERDVDATMDLLGQIEAETHGALEELRELARGIYPPLLADRGLEEALEAQARKAAIPIAVDGDGVGRYRREVESAVYFSCLEALNNIAKYAEASRASVRLRARDGLLSFEVEDDGRGFDPAATGYGTGLQGIADRLDAIGGQLRIESEPGAGTTIVGRVPVSPEP